MTLVALSPLRAVHAGASSTWLATMRPPRSKNRAVLPHHVLRMSEFIAGDGRRERVKSEK